MSDQIRKFIFNPFLIIFYTYDQGNSLDSLKCVIDFQHFLN